MEHNVFIPNNQKTKPKSSVLRRSVALAGFLAAAVGVWYGSDYVTSAVISSGEYVANGPNAASVALSDGTSVVPRDQLQDAQAAMQSGNSSQARATLQDVVSQATTQTDALVLLTQLDLAEGNPDAAIANARRVTALEPYNPARYYQLGVLFMSAGRLAEAREAYDYALQLDPEFANARYFHALLLAEGGDVPAAIVQLQQIAQANPDNQQLQSTIAQLQAAQASSTHSTSTQIVE